MATTTGSALVSTAPTVVQTPQYDASKKQMFADLAAKRKLQAANSKGLTQKALGKLKELDAGFSVRDKSYFNQAKGDITDYYTKMLKEGADSKNLGELDAYINDYNTSASQSAEMNKYVESMLGKVAEKGDESLYTPESIQQINDWLEMDFADKVENFDKLQLSKHPEFVDADSWMVKNAKEDIFLIDNPSIKGDKIIDENALVNASKSDALSILMSRRRDDFDYLSARDGRYTLLNNINEGTVEVGGVPRDAQEYLNQLEFQKPISSTETQFIAPTGQNQLTIKQDDKLRKEIMEAGDQAFLEVMDAKMQKGEVDEYTLRDYEEYKLMNNELEKLYRRHNTPMTKQPRAKQEDKSLNKVTTGEGSELIQSIKIGEVNGKAIKVPSKYTSQTNEVVEITDKSGMDISGVNTRFSNGKLIKLSKTKTIPATGDITIRRGIKTATTNFSYELEQDGVKKTIEVQVGQPIPDGVEVEDGQYTLSDWVEIPTKGITAYSTPTYYVPLSEIKGSLKSLTGRNL